jgi:hypothetical protein
MADLDVLTRRAALGSRWRFIGYDERADAVRFAILEHLLTATYRPDLRDLVATGKKAIRRQVQAEEHWSGISLTRTGVAPGPPMPRFLRYWHSATTPTRSPEDPIVDTLALRQIWPKLTNQQRAALVAPAMHDDYHKAAAELGTAYHTLVSHLFNARRQFLRWWYQHEIPSRPWAADRRKRDPAAGPSYHTPIGNIRRRQRRADSHGRGTSGQ